MTMDCFQQLEADGHEIHSLIYMDDGYFKVGKHGVTSIKTTLVAGQGGYVTWFEVKRSGKPTIIVNPIHLIGVEVYD